MADLDSDVEIESDLDLEDDDDIDVEESDEEAEETPLDDLYEHEMVAEQAGAAALEDDDEFIAKAMESAGDETTETLSFKVRPKAPGEFQCTSCFLVKGPSQLADSGTMVCVDCA